MVAGDGGTCRGISGDIYASLGVGFYKETTARKKGFTEMEN